MTTCSISKTVIAKGSRVAKRACVMPGASVPVRRISPVCCASLLICADYPDFTLSFRSMASDNVLSLEEVTVRRGDSNILGPLSLTLKMGQRWVILGPNGAGKSTLLQLIATRIYPTTGRAQILDQQM